MGQKKISFNKTSIGSGEPTFIIAEVGINHDGEMDKAFKLIDEAKNSGADAVKLQTYLTEKRVPKNHKVFDILKKCELSFDDQKILFDYGRETNITVFSTPFDDESVDFLNDINCPIYKIASFDSVNTKLLKKVGQLKRPVIMSTGMTSLEELGKAWTSLGGKNDGEGCELAIMHCVSSYPLKIENSNLAVIDLLHEVHNGPVGYSDHTIGTEAAILSVAAGASLIEKHFTLDTSSEGPDHSMSADPKIMLSLVKEIRKIEGILGSREMTIRETEKEAISYRRPS